MLLCANEQKAHSSDGAKEHAIVGYRIESCCWFIGFANVSGRRTSKHLVRVYSERLASFVGDKLVHICTLQDGQSPYRGWSREPTSIYLGNTPIGPYQRSHAGVGLIAVAAIDHGQPVSTC